MQAVGATTSWMDGRAPVEALRLRRLPLLAAACAFAAGELLALQWQFAALLAVAVTLLVLLTLLSLRSSLRVALLPVLALWAVAGCWCVQMQPSPARQTQLLTCADGLSRAVRGHVVRVRHLEAARPPAWESEQPWRLEPGQWAAEGNTATESIDLEVEAVEYVTPDTSEMRAVEGGLRVTVLDGSLNTHCGEVLELPLRLRVPERYRDPGAWSYADQLLREGIAAQANVKADRIARVGTEAKTVQCRLYAAQAWGAERMRGFIASRANLLMPAVARLTPDDAVMLNAMLFGDRTGLRRDLRLGFERTGSFHLFVVSGLHIGLLAGLLFWCLRRLRMAQGPATLLTIAAATAYAAVTGFGVPAQRALLMTSVFLLARWLWREIDILQAIGAAALAVLVHDPRALRDASFQMTFLALLAVGGIAVPLAERAIVPRLRAASELDSLWLDARLPPRLAQTRLMLRMLSNALAACCGAWIRPVPAFVMRAALRMAELALVAVVVEACMALPMAMYFHRATPLALPANLFAVPLVGVLAPMAVLTFCATLFGPWVAAIPSALTVLLLHAVHGMIRVLSHATVADARVPAPDLPYVGVCVVLLGVACWGVRQQRRFVLLGGIAATALIPVAALWPSSPQLQPNALEVTALDVGQGDSLFVVSPEGRTLLVDAGGPIGQPANADNRDVGEEVVAPYLWSRHLRRLDAVALTHAHSDHMGGMAAILRDFRPRELWVSIDPSDSPDYRALLAEAARIGVTVRHYAATDLFPWGGAVITVLAPEPAYVSAGAPRNDDSLVLRVDYGTSSVLLEGDAERQSEDTMLANQRVGPVTLLKVGHHGSRTSTTPEFLAAAAPREAVISVGQRNTFGHPRYEVLERLEQSHVKTWRTDRAGAITFLFTANGSMLSP